MEGAAAVAMHLAYEVKIADWKDAETGLCVVEHSLGVGVKGDAVSRWHTPCEAYTAHIYPAWAYAAPRVALTFHPQRLLYTLALSSASFQCLTVFPLSTYRPRHYCKKLFKKLIPAVPPLVKIEKADELPVHNRKGVGNQKNRGGYIW